MAIAELPDDRLDVELPASGPPLAVLRQWIADILADLHPDQVHDIMLVATELVANAYDHAKAPRRVRVHRLHANAVVRVEVDDGKPGRFPTLGRFAAAARRGRGLLLVNQFSRRWGHVRRGNYKTVWAEMPAGILTT